MRFLPLLTSLLVAGASGAMAQTILSTDFSNAAAGSYANGATIGTGVSSSQLTALSVGTGSVSVVSLDGGVNALQITDNDSSSASFGVYKTFAGSSMGSQTTLQGSVTFEPLTLASGTRSYLALTLNSGNTAGPGGNTAIQLYLRDNLKVQFRNGGTDTTAQVGGSDLVLSVGVTYRYDFTYDFTNPADQKWQFSISNVDTASVVYTSALLDTRSDITTTGNLTLGLQGAAYTSGTSPSPYLQVDSITLAAVPEPGAPALLLAGGLTIVLLCRRRR